MNINILVEEKELGVRRRYLVSSYMRNLKKKTALNNYSNTKFILFYNKKNILNIIEFIY